MPWILYILRINAYVGGAKLEPFDVVVSRCHDLLLIIVFEVFQYVIGDICNTNDDMVII